MTRFQPIPAVDIRGGRCVRLLQGDYARETVYGDDPAQMAKRWEAEGAERLHVVDLDGAREGTRPNAEVIRRLIESIEIPVQVGGGIRSLEVARQVLDDGADRVVVGTAAVEAPERLTAWLDALGAERVLVGVDARDGRVATHGWLETTDIDALDFCRSLADVGVRRVFFTDIGRDGTLRGPNVAAVRAIAAEGRLRVLASGGVSSVEHVRALALAGAEGAIVGKALYDGRVRLAELLAAARAMAEGAAC